MAWPWPYQLFYSLHIQFFDTLYYVRSRKKTIQKFKYTLIPWRKKNNGHSYLHYYTATTTYFLCSQQKKICAIVTDLFNLTDFIIATTHLFSKVQLEIIWKQSWLTMPKNSMHKILPECLHYFFES